MKWKIQLYRFFLRNEIANSDIPSKKLKNLQFKVTSKYIIFLNINYGIYPYEGNINL